NNRRIMTKAMWYNGTELSTLARRALEHEQVTIVAHACGYIHSIYPEATIDPKVYAQFKESLSAFLNTSVSFEIFVNFLRSFHRYQSLFQLCCPCQGSPKYISLEKAFSYEHGSKNRLGDKTSKKLLCEFGDEDLFIFPLENRAILYENDPLFAPKSIAEFLAAFTKQFPALASRKDLRDDLKRFVHTVPRLPGGDKTFIGSWQEGGIEAQRHRGTKAQRHKGTKAPGDVETGITTDQTREEILNLFLTILHPESNAPNPLSPINHPASGIIVIASVAKQRYPASSIELAFYAGRFMDHCDWTPFLKAAFERNPVSIGYFHEMDLPAAHARLLTWPNTSIYEGNRLALPDEVVNFTRGDGIEKALTLANVIRARHPGEKISLTIDNQGVVLKGASERFHFQSGKQFTKQIVY
ncbi:MAG: hypothetical protein V1733_08140, partial [bacterium]